MRNAFSAFGFEVDDATIDTLRTDLAFALRQFIERSQTGQVQAGKVLGLKQSVVSQIVRGDIAHLSVERLIRAMVKAKITGFAEWGESPELARAGAGFRVASVPATIVTFSVGNVYTRVAPVRAANAGDVPVVNSSAPTTNDDQAH